MISEFIMPNFNVGISTARFSDIFKIKSRLNSIFEKKSGIDKENYSLVSILSVLSKIFDILVFKQLITFSEPVCSKYQCGFWEGNSA